MKYAILGAGAMGSIIGSALAKGGQEVVLVDPNREHMDSIRKRGLRLTLDDVEETVRMHACTDPGEAGQADVVVLLVKGFLSETALRGALGLFREDSYACTLQNGLGNADILEPFVPRERILQGVVYVAGRQVAAGEVVGIRHGDTEVFLGSLLKEGSASGKARIMAGHLSGGGLETRYKDDVEKDIWDKVVTNAAVNATCGVLRLNVRQLYGHPEGRRLMHDLTAESVKVAAAMGIVLDLDAAFRRIEVAATVHGDHYPSMAQDMKNRRKTEIDSVNGAISRYGRQAGIPTPANDLLTRLVKIIEENYESQF